MVEDSLRKNTKIKYFTTNVGKGNPQIYYNVPQQEEKLDFAQIFIQMDADTKPVVKNQVINQLRSQFVTFPYAKIEVNDFEQGPPIEAPISIRVFGENLDTLRQLSFEVERILKSNSGVIYVNNELNTLKTDIKVNIQREKARTLGVFTSDIDKSVRLAVSGLKMGTYTDSDGDDYDIVVNAPKGKTASLNVLSDLFVNNALGGAIPLNQVANVDLKPPQPVSIILIKTGL